MSNWIVPTQAHMAAILPSNQLDTLVNSYNTGNVDRFALICAAVVADIRSAVAMHGRFISATAGSVPPEAHIRALYLILEGLQPSLPTLALEKDQLATIKESHDWVNMVRESEAIAKSVTLPTDPLSASGEVQVSPAAMSIGTTVTRQFTREKTNGL